MSSPDPAYSLRRAHLQDIPVLATHREAMFREMGVTGDYEVMGAALSDWLHKQIAIEGYRSWVIEDIHSRIVASGGLVRRDSAPSPWGTEPYSGHVCNVYVVPAHRGRGLARQIMSVIHDTCQIEGIRVLTLHASDAGRALYEAIGYQPTNEMRFFVEPAS